MALKQQKSDQHSGYSFTFTRGQDVCVSLLLAKGQHGFARRAIRWALRCISSFFNPLGKLADRLYILPSVSLF